jgi:hypothetical protein
MKRILILLLLIFSTSAFSLNVRFSGDFSSAPTEIQNLISNYVSEYTESYDTLMGTLSNSFAQANITQPVFGSPNQNFALGVVLGSSWTTDKLDENKPGGETLNSFQQDLWGPFDQANLLTIGFSGGAFLTISTHWLGGIFRDTDLTFKLFYMDYQKFMGDDVETAESLNFGINLRKELLSKTRLIPLLLSFEGISLSTGLFYASSQFTSSQISMNESESVQMYNNSSVTFDADSAKFDMNIKNLALDAEIKAYFNIFYFVDIFGGAGLSFNFYNSMEVDSRVNGTLSADYNSGTFTDSKTGALVISGEGEGNVFVPRLSVGVQLNVGPVKVPIQYSVSYADLTIKTLSAGVTLAF